VLASVHQNIGYFKTLGEYPFCPSLRFFYTIFSNNMVLMKSPFGYKKMGLHTIGETESPIRGELKILLSSENRQSLTGENCAERVRPQARIAKSEEPTREITF
jgi:hypothetical protein